MPQAWCPLVRNCTASPVDKNKTIGSNSTRMNYSNSFVDALLSRRRSAELADADDIFGFLIGDWDVDAILYDAGGNAKKIKGEVHATWVLEGRAIQDLFIFPDRARRSQGISVEGDRYATTIRTYDRTLNAWRINFINPAADDTNAQLVAHRQGDGVEMEGTLSNGTPIRWRYITITSTSFHYIAQKMSSDGKTWQLYLELFGTRSA